MAEPQANSGSTGWWIVLGVIVLLASLGMCTSRKSETARSFASQSLSEQIATMPSPTATAIASLDLASLRRAHRHLDAVMEVEGLSGAMIYSQNCYDALSRAFDWAKLDQCGGFDLLAVQAVDRMPVDGLDTEAAYFGSEEAAGRYLAVAVKGGEEPEDADLRWSRLVHEAEKLAPAPAGDTSAPAEATDPAGDEDAPLEIEVEEGAA
jgi:hypothetical protein